MHRWSTTRSAFCVACAAFLYLASTTLRGAREIIVTSQENPQMAATTRTVIDHFNEAFNRHSLHSALEVRLSAISE